MKNKMKRDYKKDVMWLSTHYVGAVVILIFIAVSIPLISEFQKKHTVMTSINGILKELNKISKKGEQYQVTKDGIFILNETKDKIEIPYALNGEGYITVDENQKLDVAIKVGKWCFTSYNDRIIAATGSCASYERTYQYTGSEQVFVAPTDGTYKIELWGAASGRAMAHGVRYEFIGAGAFVSGEIELKKNEVLYIQVGGKGGDGSLIFDQSKLTPFGYPGLGGKGGYNGGGKAMDNEHADPASGGGGATDVRLTTGAWNDFDSLKSRIMVAAGGGGTTNFNEYQAGIYAYSGIGGAGGTTVGLMGRPSFADNTDGIGATQVAGNQFGIGGDGKYCKTTLSGLAGGAGGYYGSTGGACNPRSWQPAGGAGGGSSFVSGCKGCNAVAQSSTENNVIHTNQSIHYSKKSFTNINMIDGDTKMLSITGEITIGNRNHGSARITKK